MLRHIYDDVGPLVPLWSLYDDSGSFYKYLVDIYIVADKYMVDLLTKAVVDVIKEVASEMADCIGISIDELIRSIQTAASYYYSIVPKHKTEMGRALARAYLYAVASAKEHPVNYSSDKKDPEEDSVDKDKLMEKTLEDIPLLGADVALEAVKQHLFNGDEMYNLQNA
jgi:hypothetical protein